MTSMFSRLFVRGCKYGLVGGLTYLFDLILLYTLVNVFAVALTPAVAVSFFIAITINYFISYHWVFKGTERNIHHGYYIFILIAAGTAVGISYGTTFLIEQFTLPLLIARTAIALVVGTANYLLNTFFNFKLL